MLKFFTLSYIDRLIAKCNNASAALSPKSTDTDTPKSEFIRVHSPFNPQVPSLGWPKICNPGKNRFTWSVIQCTWLIDFFKETWPNHEIYGLRLVKKTNVFPSFFRTLEVIGVEFLKMMISSYLALPLGMVQMFLLNGTRMVYELIPTFPTLQGKVPRIFYGWNLSYPT